MSELQGLLPCPVERVGERAVMRPDGEIDLGTAARFKELGADLVVQGVRFLAVDLSKVSFMDSTGLGALVVILKRLRNKDGRLCLFAGSSQIRGLLSMTGLEAVFHMEPDENAAERYLSASQPSSPTSPPKH